ncbi:MAG TPA: hypothetical protein VHM67_12645 [Gemmatimonadaceae bacterium]|nr:hypothetical protein [Gemmatimonadaceae bacterium]
MTLAPLFMLETHGTGAVLYLRNPLSDAGAREAMDACDALPPAVSRLRVDMRSLSLHDVGAVDAITARLGRWRGARNGSTRLDMPGVPVSFEVLAAG